MLPTARVVVHSYGFKYSQYYTSIMKFEDYCKKNSDEIYKKVSEYLPNRAPKEHYKMVRDYTNRRGKYARPNLALLWCELYGAKKENAFLPACGIQLAEDWILMHDDWEDGNELRRGKPTLHKLYGDVYAVNAGDSAHMIMWKILHDASQIPNPQIGERLYDKFYDILLVTAEGQYYDLALTRSKSITRFTLEDYWQSIYAKSVYYSVCGPMQLGAIAAGQPEKIIEKIKEYGVPIGNAFQTKDDLLDCTSTEDALGKTIGNDVCEGVKTSILWHFVRNASPAQLEFANELYSKDRKEKSPFEIKKMLSLFKETKSIDFAQNLVDTFSAEALQKFEEQAKGIPESDIKETARDAMLKMAARKK